MSDTVVVPPPPPRRGNKIKKAESEKEKEKEPSIEKLETLKFKDSNNSLNEKNKKETQIGSQTDITAPPPPPPRRKKGKTEKEDIEKQNSVESPKPSSRDISSDNAFNIPISVHTPTESPPAELPSKVAIRNDRDNTKSPLVRSRPTNSPLPKPIPDRIPTYSAIEEKYKIIKQIGAGSWAKVFLIDCGEMKVLKKYDLSAMSPESLKMISEEIKTIRILVHPNIIKYEDCFFVPGFLCLILDYCNNGDLEHYIEKKQKSREIIKESEMFTLFRSILSGVEYIHNRGVIHRDLKPANVFLNHINECIIGDFGLATQCGKGKDKEQGPMGSPRYMAPEILTIMEYTPKVDIWALGCILHELCDYRPAFDGKSYKELVDNIRFKPVVRISSYFKPEIQVLIDDMLNKDALKRPAAGELLERVDRLITEINATEDTAGENDKASMYPIIKQIGQGSCGNVYLCHAENGTEVAVLKKIDIKDLDINLVLMIESEIKLLKELDSPYVEKYKEGFILPSNHLCLVVNYFQNGDLNGVIKKQLQQRLFLNEMYILRFFVPIVRGVAYIHEKELLHRDLKPSNVFLGPQFNPVIGDFGITKLALGQDITKNPKVKMNYMAPEGFSGFYDKKSDIWGLGCILYELATLSPLFQGVNMVQVTQAVYSQPIPRLPIQYFSSQLQSLMEKMLNRNALLRPTAKQLLEDPLILSMK